jgi:endo-1,4-beta-xylanase
MSKRKFALLPLAMVLMISLACNLPVKFGPQKTAGATETPSRPSHDGTATPTLQTTSTNTITATPPEPSLRNYAELKGLQFGTYFPWQGFNDPAWKAIAGREFDLAILFDGFDWASFEPQPGSFDFSLVDPQVDFGLAHDMQICAHTLFWPSEISVYPEWVLNGDFSRAEMTEKLKTYIGTVMQHYKGKINCWVVVEEPYNQNGRGWDLLYSTFGSYEYLDLVYQIARDNDPHAVLIYNDEFNMLPEDENTVLTHQIVDNLKQKGLLDGVGMEMHLSADEPPDKADVINTMISYNLPVHITEIDINLTGIAGTLEERLALQSQIYSDMLSACLDSGVCKSFSVWGFGDKYSFLERYYEDADPTLFDDALQPKPAYKALLEILKP